ncbi:MAG: sulfotransferase domain-containing protein [Actinomycetota bacterium]
MSGIERRLKRVLSPATSPAARRRLIAWRDAGVGQFARLRYRREPDRMRPSLIIVGAQKAGTTYLFHQLALHPDVATPLTKELHFFDDRYDRGLGWYLGHFPSADHGAALTLEASPGYLFHPHALRRLADDLPDVRIVVLLRDPIKRAYSHFLHERRLGYEPEPDFARALDLEAERIGPDLERLELDPDHTGFAWRHFSYVARGEYAGQLRRCHEIFGRDRVLILRSEEMFAEPRAALAETVAFAGLAPFEPERLAPNDMGAGGRPQFDHATERRLHEHFAAHERELEEYLASLD